MKITAIETYKVIEADTHISIIPAKANVANALNLVIAPMATCCEYLARYTYERARGATPEDAHRQALKGARVIGKEGDFDKPKGLVS